MSGVAACPQIAPASAPAQTDRAPRLVAIDAMRGLALWLMALEHAAGFAHVRTQAEHYTGRQTILWSWPYWVTGLITNIAPLVFWFAAGLSVCLYAAGKRRSGASESSVRR